MNKLIATTAILATFAVPALAGGVNFGDTTNNRNNAEAVAEQSQGQMQGQLQGQNQSANNAGNSQSVSNTYKRSVASPTAPSFGTGDCQEAWSAGATGYWLGLSAGRVTIPDFCENEHRRASMAAAGFGQTTQQQMLVNVDPIIRDAAIAQGVAVHRSQTAAATRTSSQGRTAPRTRAGVSGANR